MTETPEPKKPDRATDRQVALVAEEAADGAYEIRVESSDAASAGPAESTGGSTTGPSARRPRWGAVAALLIVSALLAAVLLWPRSTTEGPPATVTTTPETPTFRAWIVPQDDGTAPAEPTEHAHGENGTWAGEPQVAGVVYRGPDATTDEQEPAERRSPRVEPREAPAPSPPRRPLSREAPAPPPRWHAPHQEMRVDPDLAQRLRTIPVEATLELQLDAIPDDGHDDEWYDDEQDDEDEAWAGEEDERPETWEPGFDDDDHDL